MSAACTHLANYLPTLDLCIPMRHLQSPVADGDQPQLTGQVGLELSMFEPFIRVWCSFLWQPNQESSAGTRMQLLTFR